MTTQPQTMAQQARDLYLQDAPIPTEFGGENVSHLGGEMEYITRYADGSYLSVTPSSGGGWDYFAMPANHFD